MLAYLTVLKVSSDLACLFFLACVFFPVHVLLHQKPHQLFKLTYGVTNEGRCCSLSSLERLVNKLDALISQAEVKDGDR